MILTEVEIYGMSFILFLFCIHFFTARRKTSKFFLQRQPHFLLLVVDLWSLRIPQLTKTHSIVNLSKSVRRTKRSRIDALSAQKSSLSLSCFLPSYTIYSKSPDHQKKIPLLVIWQYIVNLHKCYFSVKHKLKKIQKNSFFRF